MMKNFLIFLILFGFIVLIPSTFANCISLPCDDANIKLGEPNYEFIDFSYQNKIGEQIKFILEKTAYSDCNSYNAEITDEDGNLVWGEGAYVLCEPNENSHLVTSQIKIGYNADNPIIINDPGIYYIKIEIDDGSIEREFVVHNTNSGFTLDRTVYPVPWERGPPLKQFKDGFTIDEIYCKGDLELIQKYNGLPACVTARTAEELIKRGWTIYDVPNTFDYVIETDGVTYGSQYEISGGTVDEIIYDEHRNSLIISSNGIKQGYLQIVIQTGLLHSPRELPFNYLVIEDGEEIEFEQLSPIILKIQFEKETKQIEIIGVEEI